MCFTFVPKLTQIFALILLNRSCEADKKYIGKGVHKRKFDKVWINVLYKRVKPFSEKSINSQNTIKGEKQKLLQQKSWAKSNFQTVIQNCTKAKATKKHQVSFSESVAEIPQS